MKTPKKAPSPAPSAPLRHAYFVYAERDYGSVTSSINTVINTSGKILSESPLMQELRDYLCKQMDEVNKGVKGRKAAGGLIIKSLTYLGELPAHELNETL